MEVSSIIESFFVLFIYIQTGNRKELLTGKLNHQFLGKNTHALIPNT